MRRAYGWQPAASAASFAQGIAHFGRSFKESGRSCANNDVYMLEFKMHRMMMNRRLYSSILGKRKMICTRVKKRKRKLKES